MDRPFRQKINMEALDLNDTLDQIDLTLIQNIPTKAVEYSFFLGAHGTLSRLHYVRPQTSLSVKQI